MRIFSAIGAAIAALKDPDGRRAWALALLAGGGASMTAYAGAALYLERDHPAYVFSLGLAAHLSIVIVLTGFAGLLIKRTIKAGDGKRSLEISDQSEAAPAVTTTTTTEVKS